MFDFNDIRPYNDDEVRPTLLRLLDDSEFIDAVVRLNSPLFSRLAAPLMRSLARRKLAKEVAGITSVADLQSKIEGYMAKNLAATTRHISFSGLDQLRPDRPHLFISNHRDIAMDPAFVNWVLYKNGFQTLRIAIGDNLLTKPFASDLMRLNKSFIVNRSATSPREKLKAAKKLSAYIHHSLHEDGANIWIAQREGRAKDSLDITNPAIISMLALNKPKPMSFGDYIASLNIVPVSISYEYDPCDEAKARELTLRDQDGNYVKGEQEDVQSIARGITGQKGNVHIAFGKPLTAEFESADQIAEALNATIAQQYVLHPSNCAAYEKRNGHVPKVNVGEHAQPFSKNALNAEREQFEARLAACPSSWRERWLDIYANPVVAKLKYSEPAV